MDFYGIVFIYAILKHYALLLDIQFESFGIESKTGKGTKFNEIKWDEVEHYIDDLLKGYNLQYQRLVRNIVKSIKGEVTDEAEALISNLDPFIRESGFYNIWLGEKNTLAERAIVQPLPYVSVNHIMRITGCKAIMHSSVDQYKYNVVAYSNRLMSSKGDNEAEKTTYKYILSRLVNEKATTLVYNQLAKNECPQELNSIFKKVNKMLDKLRETKTHEQVTGITVADYVTELSKYESASGGFISAWYQVYEPFDISERAGYTKIDPNNDADIIISQAYA